MHPTFVMKITMKFSSANMCLLVVNAYVIEINGILKCCSWYTVIPNTYRHVQYEHVSKMYIYICIYLNT